jgi:enoyl-CoA hydratase
MEDIRVEVSNGVAEVTLDRPPVNALRQQTYIELTEAFDDLSRRRDVNVAILAAVNHGNNVFCGGVDLKESPKRHRTDGRLEDGEPKGDPRFQVDPGRVVRECFWSVYDCSIPVICASFGSAFGAGMALPASADLIYAAEGTTFVLSEINVGVLGGVKHAQRVMGPFLSKRIFLTGEPATAEELYRRGMLEALLPPDELMPTVRAVAALIAQKSPIAVRLAKESANRVEYMNLKEGYRTEQDYTTRIRRFADSEEARLAKLEKRTPDFRWE